MSSDGESVESSAPVTAGRCQMSPIDIHFPLTVTSSLEQHEVLTALKEHYDPYCL